MRLPAGSRLGPYEIVELIGIGGMGEVYRALDTRLDRYVAIKIINERLADDAAALRRFQREARAIAALSHPNVVAIYEFDVEHGTPFVVTEILDGSPLRSRIGFTPLPWRKAIEFAVAVAEGLAAAHARAIVHRDLKPENIFITAEGSVKIVDFGIAHIISMPGLLTDTSSATPELESSAVGTVGYASPEQLSGRPAAATTDIFSLGVILYEMLTGIHPFRKGSVAETVAAVLNEAPAPLKESGVPAALHHVVMRCLEKNPNQRFQSARDLAARLREVASDTDGRAPRSGAPRLRRIAAQAGGTALLLTIVAVALFENSRSPAQEITSLAVLPIANATSDPSLDYLSDGMTENLIESISQQLPSVRVMAPPAVSRYKNRRLDPAQIAHDLGVRALATGTMAMQGADLVINTDLIDAKDGAKLWSARYARPHDEVRFLTHDIAKAIAAQLGLSKGAAEGAPASTRLATSSSIAYDLYLKGLHELRQETPSTRVDAMRYFEQAVEIDPKFARAWAALAEAYIRSSNQTDAARMRDKGRQALARALEADPNLPEAHVSLGMLHVFEWNLRGGEVEFKKALAANPSLAQAHVHYSHMLRYAGRFREAIAHAKTATELDPFSRSSSAALAMAYVYSRDSAKALAEITRLLHIAPNFHVAHHLLGLTYEQQGRLSEACGEYLRSAELFETDTTHVDALRRACRGDSATALNAFYREELRFRLASYSDEDAITVAGLFASLGEQQKMYEYLEKAVRQKSSAALLLNIDPTFDALREQPRFKTILQQIGFPENQKRETAVPTPAGARAVAN